jgi:hypothetical protein
LAAFFPQTALCLNRLATEGVTDFAALENALLAALKHDGARWLEELLNDPALPCPNNQPRPDEQNFGPRPKAVLLTLGWITLRRAYFYSAERQEGRFALDAALGLVDSYSPGVTRWMCRAAALAGSYQAASQDLLTYAALDIDARQIQRMVLQMAPRMTQWREAQGPVFNPAAGDIFCVGTDGTGAPMRRQDLRGRKGKNGRARTREVKVGTVFTHRKPDQPDQRPERDYESTTYIADIVTAKEFGTRLRAEATRRGIAKAKTIVFLGDGARWVWELARINFPEAICILDYYHACEHLTLLSQALYGEGSALAKKRFRQWRKALLKDKITPIVAQAKADLPARGQSRKAAQKQIGYFQRNQARMLYQTFRQAGCFIGSGVVEAGCKTVVGQRLKLSGMLWSRKGASDLLTIRCALLSGWFESFWKHQSNPAPSLAFAA